MFLNQAGSSTMRWTLLAQSSQPPASSTIQHHVEVCLSAAYCNGCSQLARFMLWTSKAQCQNQRKRSGLRLRMLLYRSSRFPYQWCPPCHQRAAQNQSLSVLVASQLPCHRLSPSSISQASRSIGPRNKQRQRLLHQPRKKTRSSHPSRYPTRFEQLGSFHQASVMFRQTKASILCGHPLDRHTHR